MPADGLAAGFDASVAWVAFEVLLFVALLAVGAVAVWRLTLRHEITALVCPHCSERTALTRSKPDIDCRHCRRPLRRGGSLVDGVEQRRLRLVGRNASPE